MGTWDAGTEKKTRAIERKRDTGGKKMEESRLAELTISGGFVRMRGGFVSVFMGSDEAL